MRPEDGSFPAVDTLLERFGGEYGRLCYLVAGALSNGRPPGWVLAASRGEGKQYAQPIYVELRWQRARCNSILAMCKAAGIAPRTLIDAARSSRDAVEQEFMLTIPRM